MSVRQDKGIAIVTLKRQGLESSDCKDHSQDNQSDGPDGLEPGAPVNSAAMVADLGP